MYVVKHTPRRGLSRYRGRGMRGFGLGDAYSDCTTKCYSIDTSTSDGSAQYTSCMNACNAANPVTPIASTSNPGQTAATTNGIAAAAGNLFGGLFGGGQQPMYLAQSGMSTTTLLLLAAAGIGIVFIAMKD